jgi:D-glutamate cyclase
MPSTDIERRIHAIEEISQTEVGRNIGPLARAATGGLFGAAKSLADAPGPSVVILTGAYIPWASPAAAETDGPPGSAILAAGLQALGIPARLLTDSWCLPVVSAAIRATAPKLLVDRCDGDHDIRNRLALDYQRSAITHLIAIERLGPSADGRVRNFRGEDVTAFTAPLDSLMKSGPWKTIGVGDGGNELGMGNIPQAIVSTTIDEGEQVHCITPCDHLIVSGVSNWGALALLLALALLRDTSIRDVTNESGAGLHQRVVEACVDAGAVDGTLGRGAPLVDGLDTKQHEAIISQMWRIAESTNST